MHLEIWGNSAVGDGMASLINSKQPIVLRLPECPSSKVVGSSFPIQDGFGPKSGLPNAGYPSTSGTFRVLRARISL